MSRFRQFTQQSPFGGITTTVIDTQTGQSYSSMEAAQQAAGVSTGDMIKSTEYNTKGPMAGNLVRVNPDGSKSPASAITTQPVNSGVAEPNRADYDIQAIDPTKLKSFNLWEQLATQQGPSQAAQYQMMENLKGRQQQIDAAKASAATSAAEARSQLASRGGLRAGAAERLAGVGMENAMKSTQGAYRQAGTNLLDILKQDEANKRSALGQFTGLETGFAKDKQQLGMDFYKLDLDKWGADRQARAMENAARFGGGGGGGSVICTHALQKGLLDPALYDADIKFAKTMNPAIIRGYQWWAVPYVEVMREYPVLEKIAIPLMQARAEEVAYQLGVRKNGNLLGKVVRAIGEPICYLLGLVVPQKDWQRLYN